MCRRDVWSNCSLCPGQVKLSFTSIIVIMLLASSCSFLSHDKLPCSIPPQLSRDFSFKVDNYFGLSYPFLLSYIMNYLLNFKIQWTGARQLETPPSSLCTAWPHTIRPRLGNLKWVNENNIPVKSFSISANQECCKLRTWSCNKLHIHVGAHLSRGC